MNDFVNSLLDKQHIRKRKYTGQQAVVGQQIVPGKQAPGKRAAVESARRKLSLKPAFRPKSISALFTQNSRVIEKIRQEPARILRRHLPPRSGAPAQALPVQSNESSPGPFSLRRIKLLPSFALSMVSAGAVFSLALGIFFIIYSQGGSMAWTGRDVISLEGDSAGRHSLALYAGVGPTEPPRESVAEAAHQEIMDAIPLDLTETFTWQSYTVRRGDSVSKIASDFSVSMDAIIASNGITNARSLREGQILRIPNMDGIPYTVKSGDSLSRISQTFGVPLEAILDANDIQSDVIITGSTLFIPGARMNRDDLRMALGELFIHPVRGARLTSPFGWRYDPFGSGVRRHHAAIDLSAPQGTPVVAAMDGRVSALGFDRTYGNFIIITHSGGFQTLYAHLHTTAVRRGDQVRQGARIGTVGSTGHSTGPHLHFAVYRNNRAVNPLDFLNPRN